MYCCLKVHISYFTLHITISYGCIQVMGSVKTPYLDLHFQFLFLRSIRQESHRFTIRIDMFSCARASELPACQLCGYGRQFIAYLFNPVLRNEKKNNQVKQNETNQQHGHFQIYSQKPYQCEEKQSICKVFSYRWHA